MFDGFKKFILRGNVIDMSVGIIIGAAFTSIVNSVVKDVISPVIGVFTSGVKFRDLFFVLKDGEKLGPYLTLEEAQSVDAITLNYGLLLNSILSFLIVSCVIYFVISRINNLFKKEEQARVAIPSAEEKILIEIRDLLKK